MAIDRLMGFFSVFSPNQRGHPELRETKHQPVSFCLIDADFTAARCRLLDKKYGMTSSYNKKCYRHF